MFRKKQGIAEGWTSGRSPVGQKTRGVAGVTIQFQVGRAGFEPRPTANHAAKPHANRALGSQGRAGEATRHGTLKTGAGELKSPSHTGSAPSFSPYRSNGLHRADTPTRRHADTPQNPTRHSSHNSGGISPKNREGRWSLWSRLPFGHIAGYRK